MNKPYQRKGATSNARVGADFERIAQKFFEDQRIKLSPNFSIALGLASKKNHRFDLGSAEAKIIVECKSHRWTEGNKVPTAKMKDWIVAMYLFQLAPLEYRKILFVAHHKRKGSGELLLAYFKRTYSHLIPDGVEFVEWDEAARKVRAAA
jgi:hypothetical protein